MSTPAKEPKKTTNLTDYIPPYQGTKEGIELSEAEELTPDLIERTPEFGQAPKTEGQHKPAAWLAPEGKPGPDLPTEKIPGLEIEGGEELITGGTTAETSRLFNWKERVKTLNPEEVPIFIQKLDEEMAKDTFIKTYPELKLNYLEIKKAALSKAGAEKALKILTPKGTSNPLNPILAELATAEQIPDVKEKNYIQAKATLELTVIEKACQEYLKEGRITAEQMQNVQKAINDAKEKLRALKESATATYH